MDSSPTRAYRIIDSALPYLIALYIVFSMCMLIWIGISLSNVQTFNNKLEVTVNQQQKTIDLLTGINLKMDRLIAESDDAKLKIKIIDTGKIVILNHVK